ncbi:Dihydroxyacetone kinase 2 [Coemansia thaxteri]|uniref:Dihydroxyacetone kinase 2 n=1 Tax=Coemansia thaxteri TaxID=2663907 RepID=A0A9W8BEC7_9FUNG|nr:Dihydroxyacetone kinase 2 [Coemansia thaxteri]KAJ2008801.1 Dihydroxyacetone kinase 2 [Coemansia thaxteri]KAJ2473565.1 Dihydroxyacetone kinase 2 [Coemansia sp. RSA 2322]KAJ2478732.1 Dihydroxyacetone kinase 2 [Coemansia sp. RSA 2320]
MSAGKHFVSDPKNLVRDSLSGLVAANPHLAFDEKQKVTYVKDLAVLRTKQVTLFCGGGSGHEPAHAGFVGHGMLTAAVSGHVFASPSSSQVLSCLRRVYSEEHGALVVIKNYTGDVLNFGRAVERFKSESVNQGKPLPKVAMVVVDDDVGVVNPNDDDEGGVGRRGLAGTVIVNKLAGARAASGASLSEVKAVAEYVVSNTFTIGCALNAASVPGQGMPRVLSDDEIEIGMGIHNEPGFETKKLEAADTLIPSLVSHIVGSAPFRKAHPGHSGRVILMVNNLGATSNLELGLITKLAVEATRDHGFEPVRVYSGTFMTGLAMPGASISLLVLPLDELLRNELLALADQPASCPGWVNQAWVEDAGCTDESAEAPSIHVEPTSNETWERVISMAYDNVVTDEPQVTLLDQLMGDGDCGQVLLSGATAIRDAAQSTQLPLNDPAAALARISSIVEDSMGGTSGIIYCLFLDGLAQQIRSLNVADNASLTPKLWGQAMLGALDTLYQYTSARPGHRTLIDALQPFASSLALDGKLELALEAADKGAAATAQMQPKRGRAVYVQQKESTADAGAAGLVSVLRGIVSALL